MKRLILVLAAVLSAAGYIVVNLTGGGAVSKTDNLIVPTEISAISIDSMDEGLEANKYIKAFVIEVIDGDTLKIKYKSKEYKVRLLCIDTPEMVGDQKYSEEAAAITEKLVLHKNVCLIFEKGLRDRYGRLLAHVIMESGKSLNTILVRNGYARVELVSPNKKYSDYFIKLQKDAILEKAGMWGLEHAEQPFIKDKNGKYVPRQRDAEEAS